MSKLSTHGKTHGGVRRYLLPGAVLALGVASVVATFAAPSRSEASISTELMPALREGEAAVTLELGEVSCAACSVDARRALLKGAAGVVRLSEGDARNRLVVVYQPAPGRPEAYVDALKAVGLHDVRLVTQ